MKRIGLLGGMSWESSVLYEELINTEVRSRLGGSNSADMLIRSYNFANIEELQAADDWESAATLLADGARRLVDGGAEVLALCSDAMHIVADQVEAATDVPFVHCKINVVINHKQARELDDLNNVALLQSYSSFEIILVNRFEPSKLSVSQSKSVITGMCLRLNRYLVACY